ncbi:polysaccharide deacetylase family protein [Candidatus Curtissbacteria bacterium]|nr:polysaccharide deacetylase family protein [Candidatus Curtissbacteria bacterium]
MKKKQSRAKSTPKYLLFSIIFLLVILGSLTLVLSNYRRTKIITSKSNLIVSQEVEDYLKESTVSPKLKGPQSLRVPMLLYHYVEYVKDKGDTIRQSLDIVPSLFDAQVTTLQAAGYTFITPSDLSQIMEGQMQVPTKPIMLTFDDGYRDFYTDVLPIIQKHNVRVVAYIVTGFLDKPNNLTRGQLREIAASGLVEIGAHTVDHSSLGILNLKRVEFEVLESKTELEKILGVPITAFAYPNGSFDVVSIQVVRDAGFKTAVTTVPGINVTQQNLYILPRLRAGGRTGQALLKYLEQNVFQAF